MPSTRPCWASDFPAPNQTARGPAIAKKPTVAMNVTKIELSATGTGTPARFMTHIDMGDESDWHPAPTHLPKRREEDVDAIALEDQVIANEECDSGEGNCGKQLEATT